MYRKGDTQGRWTVVEDQKFEWQKTVKLKCSCGTRRELSIKSVRTSNSQSCGCLRHERSREYRLGRTKYPLAVGMRFGRLTVEWWELANFVHCKCDCGNEVVTRNRALHNGNTRSCGCLKSDLIRAVAKSQGIGVAKNSLYATWKMLKRGMSDPTASNWASYGARGVRMHEPWWNDPVLFINEVEAELGPRKKRDCLRRVGERGNIEPGNICWDVARNWTDPKRRTHTDEERAEIVRLVLEEGIKQAEVASSLGLTPSYVSFLVTRHRKMNPVE